MKVVRLSVVRTDRLYPPKRYPWYPVKFPKGHSTDYSMKNSSEPIENRLVILRLNQLRHSMALMFVFMNPLFLQIPSKYQQLCLG